MNKKERFLAAVERRPVDRLPWWVGLPTEDALAGLFEYFGVSSMRELKLLLDDDVWTVELPYHSPTSDAIYAAFDFAKKGPAHGNKERTLTSPGFFEDYEEESAVELFDWPDPRKYISPETCRGAVADIPDGYPVLGVIWSAHFQDACAAFGMEDALIKMKLAPELFRAVIDRITEFYLTANEIFYEATRGGLDAVLIGNDFGTQNGLILSANDLREFVFPGTKRLVDQAHRYGLKVIHHSCGSIREVIPDLIGLGVDVIHPIQALAAGMQAEGLRDDFTGQVSFCGGVDAQYLLPNGTPQDVGADVARLKGLFSTGLIVSPSHEAVLPDIPPANIAALAAACRE